MKWTERQWQAAMRKAGWKNDGQGCWIHTETDAKFYAWTVTRWRIEKYGRGEAWYPFALDGELPTDAPF
jgi:hypothetical protein